MSLLSYLCSAEITDSGHCYLSGLIDVIEKIEYLSIVRVPVMKHYKRERL